MMDLCSIDQTPPQHYSIWNPSEGRRLSSPNEPFDGGSLQGFVLSRSAHLQQTMQDSIGNLLSAADEQRRAAPIVSGLYQVTRAVPLADHIARMRETREQLSRAERAAQRQERHREALRWLFDNRKSFAGKWVALRGADLLAVGSNAKEVYERVAGEQPPALVVKVEGEDVPFGGW